MEDNVKEYTEIKNWLEAYQIENYNINPDLSVNVYGDVNLSNMRFEDDDIKVKFKVVEGNFNISKNKLTNLEFCPKYVFGDFDCSENKSLLFLKGSPIQVGRDFICNDSNIMNIEDSPKEVGRDFIVQKNNLVSLKGFPETIGRDFYVDGNKLPEELNELNAEEIRNYNKTTEINNGSKLTIESLNAEIQASKHNIKIPENFIKENETKISQNEEFNKEQTINRQPIKNKRIKH